MLTSTFHFKVLETYLPSINKHSRSLIKNLITASENGNKSIADVESYITLCALDIVGGEYYVFCLIPIKFSACLPNFVEILENK